MWYSSGVDLAWLLLRRVPGDGRAVVGNALRSLFELYLVIAYYNLMVQGWIMEVVVRG